MSPLFLANILTSGEALWAMGGIAAWLVVVCLKVIGEDLEYATRWHDLKVQARTLRIQHLKRLKELNVQGAADRRR